MRKTKLTLSLIAFCIWLLLTWPLDFQHFIIGIFISWFVSLMTQDLFVRRPHIVKSVKRYLWFIYYVPLFIWECIKANLDVAYRVIHPDLPINPGIVKIKTNLKSDTALTFLANSITLTPGTMSVDIDPESGYLYIHWIDVKDKDIQKATEIIAKKFEDVLKRIFE
jgi:multicomponent Na+:H+ antiporter subunit E